MVLGVCDLSNMFTCNIHAAFLSPVHLSLCCNRPINLRINQKKSVKTISQSRQNPLMVAQAKDQRESKTKLDACGVTTLQFVSKIISVDGRSSDDLRRHIERLIKEEGDPVRWAIVDADQNNGTCRVDAVVSRNNKTKQTSQRGQILNH